MRCRAGAAVDRDYGNTETASSGSGTSEFDRRVIQVARRAGRAVGRAPPLPPLELARSEGRGSLFVEQMIPNDGVRDKERASEREEEEQEP